MQLPPSMSRPAAAIALEVRPPTVSEYLRKGYLRGVRLGRRWLIDRASVERLLAEGTPRNGTK
jgi:excisionase family DNA binding protein